MTLSGLNIRDFQTEVGGQLTDLYVLKNKNGMEACVTNYGARLVSLMVSDCNGKMENIVYGFPAVADYMNNEQNVGAIAGRSFGRISKATYALDSVKYHLITNHKSHCIHGDDLGFTSKIWQAEQLDENALKLTLFIPAGDSGFPGNLKVRVVYMLTNDNELDISYEAETDKPVVFDLSHHLLFNLSGDFKATIDDESLYIDADYFMPDDSMNCATGGEVPVTGTPFDFTTPRLIGETIDQSIKQPTDMNMKGYGHNWVLNAKGNDKKLAVRLYDNKSGRVLEIYTTEPGLQMYTANALRGAMLGNKGIVYQKTSAVSLEPRHLTDSPNNPQFFSTELRSGEGYCSHCVYRFGVTKRVSWKK